MDQNNKKKYFFQEDDFFQEDFELSSQVLQLNRHGMAVANGETISLLQSTGKRDFDVALYKNGRADQLRLGRALAADPIKAHAREVAQEKKKATLTAFYDPVRTLTEITTFPCCHSNCMQDCRYIFLSTV